SRSDSFMSDLTSKSDAAATQNRKDSGSLKTAEFARKQGVKVLRYQDMKEESDDLLQFSDALADPEAFRAFLKTYEHGETIVYEQMSLPFL
nr:hypothetical protein [Lachnospiraceae bacterium]